MAQSLDGYIAPPDESTDWIVNDPSIDFETLYASFDGFVMGRKTYEIITADETNNPLRGRPRASVIVISRTWDPEDHLDITVLSDGYIEAARDMIGDLSARRDNSALPGSIWLMGGGSLAAEFLAAGLLDGIDTAIMPVILGGGFKMFTDLKIEEKDKESGSLAGKYYSLQLRSLEKLDQSGILMAKYDVEYK
jgi:dihydrofolate reductase